MRQTLQQDVGIKNPYQNLGQGTYTGFGNNFSFQPTVEELNRTAVFAGDISVSPAPEPEEPLFGTHIHEAAATVKKLFGS